MKRIYILVILMVMFAGIKSIACTGARELGMGYGVIGSSNDANATYYNPASLAFLKSGSESFTANPRTARYLSNSSYISKIGSKKAIGFSETYDSFGDIALVKIDVKWSQTFPMFVNQSSEPTNVLLESNQTLWDWFRIEQKWERISFGQRISRRSAVGVNLNFVSSVRPYDAPEVANYISNLESLLAAKAAGHQLIIRGMGPGRGIVEDIRLLLPDDKLNLDISYKIQISDHLSGGILLQNLVQTRGIWEPDHFFQAFNPRAGLGYQNGRLTLGFDWYGGLRQDPMNDLLFGGEYRLSDKIQLRAGSYSGIDTMGLGWKMNKKSTLDIAKFGESYIMGYSKSF